MPLAQCNSYKYLGVIFDKNLNWKPHIEYLCQKVSKACGALVKLRHCVSINLLREVYHALINSYIRYGILVWGTAAKSTIEPLQTLVDRAVKIMTFTHFRRSNLSPIYECLKILDVQKTFRLETGKYMFKYKNDLLPLNIGNYFQIRRPIDTATMRSLRQRINNGPSLTFRLVSSEEKSIQSRGEKIWDEFQDPLRNSKSVNSFKRLLKNDLLKC